MKIGILGGTFNPIHNSHIYLATEYHKHLGLDKVLLVPANMPPHKIATDLASSADRLAMCEIASQGSPFLEVCGYEIEKGGVSYTYETLNYIEEKYPDSEAFLLMGADIFCTILDWKEPQEIIDRATLCTAPREDGELDQLMAYGKILDNYGARWKVLEIPPKPMSSTFIRQRIQEGGSAAEFVPTGVWEYIQEKNLYRKELV